ncbi:hypothetical protein OF83DRAFT_1055018 [Amylostereum chailletii]|nr:hypothetical protein OF83DRAFT_1055018 [Amylostereum chailletii]
MPVDDSDLEDVGVGGESERDQEKRARTEERRAKERDVKAKAEAAQAKQLWTAMTTKVSDGGCGFRSLHHFIDTIFTTKDQQIAATIGRYANKHGRELINLVARRAPPEVVRNATMDLLIPILRKEGDALQELFTREWHTSIATLLADFSMQKLAEVIKETAPVLWKLLTETALPTSGQGEPGRDPDLIFTTVAAMLAVLRSKRATNLQVTLGLFLLASGAAKREIEVLARAGLSVSYSQVLRHLKALSKERKTALVQAVQHGMVGIVWDNVNIPFRVGEQRFANKNHFDNGTTATILPLYDPDMPSERVPHGTLPFEMKPPRTSRQSITEFPLEHVLPLPEQTTQLVASCLWQLKQLAMDGIPELERFRADIGGAPAVLQIPVHKTEQHPAPAMLIDESSLDGAFEVLVTILKEMGVAEGFTMKEHGLLFVDGDLLTVSLVDKIESARRNCQDPEKGHQYLVLRFGLFHAKMAGCRMVVNEHWGKPNSEWPGGLCWENTFLRRKAVSAGWKNKKSTPWAPAHDLIRVSLPAHVRDGFRIHCGEDNVEQWAQSASLDDFDRVSRIVLQELFSMDAVDCLRDLPDAKRDFTFENNILYNRDTLHYSVFVSAIKRGDIGCVVNVLRVWGVMMRGVMPRYADAIFETLARLASCDPKLQSLFLHNWLVNLTGHDNGFKEVDLLQEHHNFWAKVMYTAKGVNKSWQWLSMITVCIFTLRDAMRTVHKSFKIPGYSVHHSTPASHNEVHGLDDEFEHQKLQQYVPNRPSQSFVSPVRDLFHHGADYANQPKAFHAFRQDPRHAQYAKPTTSASAPATMDMDEGIVSESPSAGPSNSTSIDDTVHEPDTPDGGRVHEPHSAQDLEREGALDDEINDDLGDRPTEADLAFDDEEFYELRSNILARAVEMIEDLDLLDDDMYA